jgi:hypothetical protein
MAEPVQPADLASPSAVNNLMLDGEPLAFPFHQCVDGLAVWPAVRMLQFSGGTPWGDLHGCGR